MPARRIRRPQSSSGRCRRTRRPAAGTARGRTARGPAPAFSACRRSSTRETPTGRPPSRHRSIQRRHAPTGRGHAGHSAKFRSSSVLVTPYDQRRRAECLRPPGPARCCSDTLVPARFDECRPSRWMPAVRVCRSSGARLLRGMMATACGAVVGAATRRAGTSCCLLRYDARHPADPGKSSRRCRSTRTQRHFGLIQACSAMIGVYGGRWVHLGGAGGALMIIDDQKVRRLFAPVTP